MDVGCGGCGWRCGPRREEPEGPKSKEACTHRRPPPGLRRGGCGAEPSLPGGFKDLGEGDGRGSAWRLTTPRAALQYR